MLTNLKLMFNKDNKGLLFDSLLELGFRLEESDPSYFVKKYRKDIVLVVSMIKYLTDDGFRLEEIFDLDNSSSGDSTSIDFAYDFYNRLSEIYDTIIK